MTDHLPDWTHDARELPIPTVTIEELYGEYIPDSTEATGDDVITEATEPISVESEEALLAHYLEVQDQERRLARVRERLMIAIETLPQEAPSLLSDLRPPASDAANTEKKTEKETPSLSSVAHTPLF